MRVGFDGRWYGGSGVGNYVAELLQALAAMPGNLELVVYEAPRNPLPDIVAANLRKVPVRAKRYSLAEQIELAWRCKRDRIEVFHAPFYITPLFAPCPVVVTIHDVIPFLFRIYSPAKQMLIQTGYRLALRKATRVLADSQKTAEDLTTLLKYPADKITVTPLAASGRWFHANGSQEELEYLHAKYAVRPPFVMISSARHWRTKNLPAALRALANCAKSGLTFQTVVPGAPDAIERAIREVDVSALTIVRTGFVPTEDLARLYRHAHAYLVASRYEGFGLPLLEAMACGCATVSSNAGSLLEVAGTGALAYDPDDSQGMGEAIARLLSDEDFRRQQQMRALQRSAEFSWRKTAERTLSVYSEALQKSFRSSA